MKFIAIIFALAGMTAAAPFGDNDTMAIPSGFDMSNTTAVSSGWFGHKHDGDRDTVLQKCPEGAHVTSMRVGTGEAKDVSIVNAVEMSCSDGTMLHVNDATSGQDVELPDGMDYYTSMIIRSGDFIDKMLRFGCMMIFRSRCASGTPVSKLKK